MPATEEKQRPVLLLSDCNPLIQEIDFAIYDLAHQVRDVELQLRAGVKKPFTQIVRANIGDGQAMGQLPITFIRETLALLALPALSEDPRFASDVRERAADVLRACHGATMGAYTDKKGIEMIRRQVAWYIEQRDGGIPANWQDVVLSAGATDGIKAVMRILINRTDGKKAGVMIPIPQYPLYSATLAEYDLQQINYYLNEDEGWGLDISELERAIGEARKICNPRAIVVINPGNPTGQVLSRKNIEEVVKFAHRERLFILSDEVYQENVYAEGSEFHSFKKVMMEMGPPYNQMELSSFMSCSKGYMGECGVRGGFSETINLDPEVFRLYMKLVDASTCPTVMGQATLYCIVKPPRPGEPSYQTFLAEKERTMRSLAERAKMVAEAFNSVPGMSCNVVQGAMYAFPKIEIPPKAMVKAKELGLEPDAFYCMELLEKTGMCVVPGSGFQQKPGTYHFRTTILPQPKQLADMLTKFGAFQQQFVKDYQ